MRRLSGGAQPLLGILGGMSIPLQLLPVSEKSILPSLHVLGNTPDVDDSILGLP